MEFTWERLTQFLKLSAMSDRYDSPYVDAAGGDFIVVDGELSKGEFDTWLAAQRTAWTTEKPTTPGWYWWVGEGGSVSDLEIVKICDYQLAGCNELQVWRMGMDVESLELFIERNGVGKWAGPLEMPG